MNIRSRRLLFVFFLLLFFLSAAIIVFVSSGYRYDWSRRAVFRPGLLAIDATPRPQRVVIDGKDLGPRHDATRILGLTPGTHTLRLERDGYFAWQGNVTINNGAATALNNLRLFRQLNATTLLEEVTAAATSPNKKHIAVVAGTPPRVFLVDAGAGTATLLVAPDAGSVDGLFWSPQSDRIALRRTVNGSQTLAILTLAGKEEKIPLRITKSDGIRWSRRSSNQMLILHDGELRSYNLSSYAATDIASNVQDWYEGGGDIFLLRRSGVVSRLAGGSQDEAPLLTLPELSDRAVFLDSPEQLLTLVDGPGRSIVVVTAQGANPAVLLRHGAVWAQWRDDGQRLLMGSEVELSTYAPRDSDIQLIQRTSSAIGDGWWVGNSRYVLISQGGALLVADSLGQAATLAISYAAAPTGLVVTNDVTRLLFVTEKKLLALPL